MYTVLALVFIAAFAVVTVAAPFRFDLRWFWSRLPRLRRAVLGIADHAVFHSLDETARSSVLWARAWCVAAAVLFVGLGVRDGTLVQNDPDAPARVAGYAAVSFAGSGLLLFAGLACGRYLPAARGALAAAQCGLRRLWLAPSSGLPRALSSELRDRVQSAKWLGVLDITGFELLAHRPGGNPPPLWSALSETPEVPVSLVLLDQQSAAMDPDRRHATVLQSVCAETGLRATTLRQRLFATLDAVDALNSERPPQGRITVRFYAEKPPLRAVFFEDSLLAMPFAHRGEPGACLEISRSGASLYEAFRRTFARLWGQAVTHVFPERSKGSGSFRGGSVAVRRDRASGGVAAS